MRVYYLDDGHGAHQEEDDPRRDQHRFAELFGQCVDVTEAQGIDGPQQAGADERGSRLAHPKGLLHGDRQVAEHEDTDEDEQHEGRADTCKAARPLQQPAARSDGRHPSAV